MSDKNRPLHILKYLWDHTDEEHPAIITDILAHLKRLGIHTNRKTVASDLVDLQGSGFDIVCNKSRQNKYFIGSRSLELAELKMIVDAIQAAKFISESKSISLIEKVSSLASPHQAEQLKRCLYVEGKDTSLHDYLLYLKKKTWSNPEFEPNKEPRAFTTSATMPLACKNRYAEQSAYRPPDGIEKFTFLCYNQFEKSEFVVEN